MRHFYAFCHYVSMRGCLRGASLESSSIGLLEVRNAVWVQKNLWVPRSPGFPVREFPGYVLDFFGPVYIYIPRTQMTLVLIGKGLCFGGVVKNRGHWGSRYSIFAILYLGTPHSGK